MFESKSGVLLVAGLGFFAFAFLSNALVPALMYRDLPEQTTSELVEKNSNLMYQFEDLSHRYPEQFAKYYRRSHARRQCAEALELGRQRLHQRGLLALPQPVRAAGVARGRPLGTGVANRGVSERAAAARDVRHAARRPRPVAAKEAAGPTTGTPCISSSRRWCRPARRCPTIPGCSTVRPTSRTSAGLALITYVQWLGSWLESYPYYEDVRADAATRPPRRSSRRNRIREQER